MTYFYKNLLIALFLFSAIINVVDAKILPLKQSHFILLNSKALEKNPQLVNALRALATHSASFKRIGIKSEKQLLESKLKFNYYIKLSTSKGKKQNTKLKVQIFNEDNKLVFGRKVNIIPTFNNIDMFGKQLYLDLQLIFPLVGKELEKDDENIYFTIESSRAIDFYLGQKFILTCKPNCRQKDTEGLIINIKNNKLVGRISNDDGKKLNKSSYIYLTQEKILDKDILNNPALFKSLNQVVINKNLNSYYRHSLRSCSLLPFIGNYDRLEKLREELIYKIKNDARCTIKDDKKFNAIFNKYSNISSKIKNTKVISTFANKLGTGSNLRVSVDKMMMGYRVGLDIIAENGQDIFFRQREVLEDADLDTISSLLLNWSIRYFKKIPYQALVKESVEGDVFFDLGQDAIHTNNQNFEVYRPTKLSLSRVGFGNLARWEKTVLARGLVQQAYKKHSVGRVVREEKVFAESKIQKGDWVNITGLDTLNKVRPVFAIHNLKKNRGKGRLKIGGNLHQLNTEVKNDSSSTNIFSLAVGLDVFLPYSYILKTEFDRTNSGDNGFGLTNNSYYASLGYSLIIEGNLMVSSLDSSIGYLTSYYPLDLADSRFLGDTSVKGLFIEFNSEIPLYEDINLHAGLRYAPSLSGDIDGSVLGDLESASVYNVLFNVDYKVMRKVSIFAEYNYESLTLTQEVDSVETSLATTKLKVGAYINF